MILLAAFAPCNAIAQQEVVETLEEVVVVGTRRQGRTAVETAVPVDVFNRQDIDAVSSEDMLDIIRTLVPSFNVQRWAINDGATFVRPPTLRGMSADKILVLVNGKRRHRSALVRLQQDGVHGPDLAAIPSIARCFAMVLLPCTVPMPSPAYSISISGIQQKAAKFDCRPACTPKVMKTVTCCHLTRVSAWEKTVLSTSVRNCRTMKQPVAGLSTIGAHLQP
jgi:hypothetical protein